ncbi:MAG: YraN family protein [Elainellaceae cyanobacterium]
MTRPKRQRALQRGHQGEAFVARVLESWGWTILHRRWHCRRGEIDLVVQESPTDGTPGTLAFVEVKVRSSGAWDDQGLAITWQKQQRLWQTAQHFLMVHEAMASVPCRFDVALVHCRSSTRGAAGTTDGYELRHYLKGAFDSG